MVVGTGVQFALPALVLHMVGEDGVGHYRAAVAISITYLGFMLTAMGLDYYPRVSAVSDQAETVVRLVNEQLRLILILIVPLIFGMLALSSIIIPRLYSPAFAPASDILEWQLVGELFRFWSWTMGMALLARGRSRTIFMVELAFGVNILLLSFLGVRWFGLIGSGVGFLAAYAGHFLIVWAIVRSDIALRWTTENVRLMLATLAALGLVQGLNVAEHDVLAKVIALAVAMLAGLWSLKAIWRDYNRGLAVPPDNASVAIGDG
jgi:PST family polysaccharide transporter